MAEKYFVQNKHSNKMCPKFWGANVLFTCFWKNYLTCNAVVQSNVKKKLLYKGKEVNLCEEQPQVIVVVVFYDTVPDVQLVITISRWTKIALELNLAS